MKKFWKLPVLLIGVVLAIVVIYVAYVFLTYERIEDYQKLSVKEALREESLAKVQAGQVYGAISYNAGFGAYLPEFLFLQEVDLNSTRSYHINQYELFCEHFAGMQIFPTSPG